SRNRTQVNGRAIPPPPAEHPLGHGDEIRLAGFLCTFLLDGDGERTGEEEPLAVRSALDGTDSSQVLKAQPAEQLPVLLEISNDLSHTLDLDVLPARVLDHLLELFPQADRGLVLLGEPPGRPPEVRAVKARRPEHAGDDRVSQSIIGRCLSRREAIRANNLP